MKTIEVHILQNFPPSNLNRDDSGAPKDCDFGGYRRQRISSQCIKRSVRQSTLFRSLINSQFGIRTKRVPEQVAKQLIELGHVPEQAKAMANEFFESLCGVNDKGATNYLLYLGPEELARATDLLHKAVAEIGALAVKISLLRTEETKLAKKEKEAKKKEIDEALKPFGALVNQYKSLYPKHVRAVDIALFGRMLADNPNESIDAACQVSHALSVNRMNMEFDYFTAVDDIQPQNNNGAGMIGTIGFASSCFYRFACVDMDQLTRNLGGDVKAAQEGMMAFAEAFIQARPSGKQNTFAAHSLPAFVLFVVRENEQPISLVNAFEAPIKPSISTGQSLTDEAITALSSHYTKLKKMYGLNGTAMCMMLDDVRTANTRLQDAGVQVQEDIFTLLASLKNSLIATA